MPSDQKDRYIRYLIEQEEEKELELRAMQLAVEEFQSIHGSVAESLANLQKEIAEFQKEMAAIKSELSSERSKRKAAESKARKLEQQLKFAQKNRFGDKK